MKKIFGFILTFLILSVLLGFISILITNTISYYFTFNTPIGEIPFYWSDIVSYVITSFIWLMLGAFGVFAYLEYKRESNKRKQKKR